MARKLKKTATYSVMHLAVAVAVAYALTQDWRIALGIGLIEPMVQTLAYSVHEALWARGKTTASAGPATAPTLRQSPA